MQDNLRLLLCMPRVLILKNLMSYKMEFIMLNFLQAHEVNYSWFIHVSCVINKCEAFLVRFPLVLVFGRNELCIFAFTKKKKEKRERNRMIIVLISIYFYGSKYLVVESFHLNMSTFE